MSQTALFAERALLPEGWARDVRLEVAADGSLTRIEAAASADGAERLAGPAMPGFGNLHSHAFQRAMAGLAERAGPGEDSFWSWRELMYRFVRALTPEQVQAIAAQLYVEMLKAGYTAVGEFHYLHHDPQGRPYSDLAEMSRRVLEAARTSGIGITVLPVLYGYGDFGGRPAGEGQRRFLNEPERFLRLVETLATEVRDDPQAAIGIAPHSLRAVTPETLRDVREGLERLDPAAPIHIHVAEQRREVDACIEWCGRRPVGWLLDEEPVDARWCLVHATHMSEEETGRLAASGAVAGLCPTTEANLGDGLFPAPEYVAAGGRFGVGSDSHVSVSPLEELRWLEYGQRLQRHRRNLLAPRPGPGEEASVGAALVERALVDGAQALGRPIGRLQGGCCADLLVLDPEAPALVGKDDAHRLDGLVFADNANPVRDVMVGGRWVVRERRHPREAEALAGFRAALAELTA